MTQTTHDWLLSLGIDTKAVDKGLDRVEQKFARLDNMRYNAEGRYLTILKRQLETIKAQEKAVKKLSQYKHNFKNPGNAAAPPNPSSTSAKKKPNPVGMSPEMIAVTRRGLDMDIQRFQKSMTEVGRKLSEGDLKKFGMQSVKLLDRIQDATDEIGFREIRQDIRHMRSEMQRTDRTAKRLGKTMSLSEHIAQGFKKAALRGSVLTLTIYGIGKAMAALGNQAMQIDSFNATLLASTGSLEAAGREFEFLKNVSLGLGTDLLSSAKSYTKLSVAAKNSALDQKQVRDVFIAVQEASIAFGLSADEAAGSVRALEQMISKGTIQAEELKGQLGDRMPGAVATMAKAVGVGTKELLKMMEAGELLTDEWLPKFGRELRNTARNGGALEAGTKSISAAMNRVSTAFTMGTVDFMDSGGKEGMVGILDTIASTVKSLTPFFQGLGALLKGLHVVFVMLDPIIQVLIHALNLVGYVVERLGALFNFVFGTGSNSNEEVKVANKGKSVSDRMTSSTSNRNTSSVSNNTVTINIPTTGSPEATVNAIEQTGWLTTATVTAF